LQAPAEDSTTRTKFAGRGAIETKGNVGLDFILNLAKHPEG
jgi:hypothetical protein